MGWSKWRIPRFRRLHDPLDKLLSLKQYGDKYHLSRSGVIYLVKVGKIRGWKTGSRWYVIDEKIRD